MVKENITVTTAVTEQSACRCRYQQDRSTFDWISWCLILSILLIFTSTAKGNSETISLAEKVDPQLYLQLTSDEKIFLQQTQSITVQNESNFAPFNFIAKGKPAGYSIDIMNYVAKQLGLEVDYIQHKTWDEYLRMLQTNQIDAMVNIAPSPQRSRYASFTASYAEISVMAVTQKHNIQVSQSEELIATQRIAVVENYAGGMILRRKFPTATFVSFKSAELALKAIANNKADIFFGNGVMANYYIEKHFITGLAFSPAIDALNLSELYLSIATHKSNPLLASLLKKSVESIPEHIKIRFRKKWGASGIPSVPKVQLTMQERQFIESINTIRVSSGIEYPPHTYTEDDIEKGFTIDLVHLLGDMLNLKIEFIKGEWSDHLNAVKEQQESLDILLDVASTESRRKYLIYTQPYYEMRSMLVMRKGQLYVEASYDDLENLTIAAIEDWAMTQQIKQYSSNVDLYPVNTPLEALQAVAEGRADGYLGNSSTSHFLIRKHQISGLQLIPWRAQAWEKMGSHAFALNHKNQQLRTILDKALLAIPDHKWIKLQEKWFGQTHTNVNASNTLSRRQKHWLLDHPSLNIHLPSFGLPIGKASNKGYEGVLADFIDYFDQKLSTQWLPQNNSSLNNQINDQLKADLTIGYINDAPLSQHFLFSNPVMNMPVVILSANPARVYVDNLAELEHTKTGIISTAPYRQQVLAQYPALELESFDKVKDAIMAVNAQDVDILLCPLLHCAYVMDELGTNKIRTIGQTEFTDSLRFAVRKDWPELVQIINSELESMSEPHRNSIYRRWNTRPEVMIKVDNSKIYYLLIAMLIIGGAVTLWNRNISKHAAKTKRYAESIEKAHEELKTAQSQLVHAEKMASIGTLTAGVAHEINNPANFIRVGVHNLKQELAQVQQFITELAGNDADPAVLAMLDNQFTPLFEHLKTITEGTQRIMVIVQDLTAFSRPDNAQENSLSLTDSIATTVNLVRTQYVDVANITTDFDHIPTISNLPTQLNQVFLNLIINAADAIKEKQQKQQIVELGNITISCYLSGKNVHITIEDDGCGMSEKTKQKLFEPFYTTKGIGKGTGLGMSVSFGIIKKHGGCFDVESTLGVGSKITIKLPLDTQQDQSALTT